MITKFFLFPLGTDYFCLGKKFLVFNLVSRNLKSKYHRSFLGWLWTIASPMSMTMVYYFTFKVILKIQQPYYLVLLLCGILPWTFFAQTLAEGTDSIVSSWGLLSKVPIPLPIFPLVGTVTNFTTLLLAFPVLLGAAIFSGCQIGISIICLPLYYGILFLIVQSLAYAFAVGYVFFRDFRHILTIILQVWFYGTPVIYAGSMIPEKYRWITILNPVGLIFIELQNIVIQGAWPNPQNLAISSSWALGLVFGVAFLHKNYFVEVVERI